MIDISLRECNALASRSRGRGIPAMRTLSFLSCKALAVLWLACGPAWAIATDASWPAAPKLAELPTPYGTLAVSESDYVYEARLQVDGVQVKPAVSGMLNISYAFQLPDRQAALIAISKGNDTCPVIYRWIILKADGYDMSPEFGSCSELIKVSADTKNLTLQTPNPEFPEKLDTYVYDGTTVTQLKNTNGKKK